MQRTGRILNLGSLRAGGAGTTALGLRGSLVASRPRTLDAARFLHRSSARHEAAPNSPWRVFVDTFRGELRKSKELQESVKALQDSTRELGESEAYRRAQEAYSKARDAGEQAGGLGTKAVRRIGRGIGSGAAAVWSSAPVRLVRSGLLHTYDAVAHATAIVTGPIRRTRAYQALSKSVREVVDDGSSTRYGGYVDREQRKQLRENKKRVVDFAQNSPAGSRSGKRARVEVNPDAGEGIVVHKDSAWRESWNNYKDQSKLFQSMQRLARQYDESENPIVASIRDLQYKFSDSWANLTAENEQAQVVRLFREMDPNFNLETFLSDLRTYILPEVLDAYISGDTEVLKLWLSEAPFSVWQATTKEFTTQGLVSAGRVLDIRGVDIHSARILPPNDIPVFVIAFRTQEVHMYKSAKTGETVAGREDHIQQVTYAAVMTRIESDLSNPETRGWRIVELARARAIDYH